MKKLIAIAACAIAMTGCGNRPEDSDMSNITEKTRIETISAVKSAFPKADAQLIERGINQTAALWRQSDGTEAEFKEFVQENFKGTAQDKQRLFEKLQTAFEQFNCYYDLLTVDLSLPTILDGPEPEEVDYLLGGYGVASHFSDDMFENKVAFITMLNFPNFTLPEKNEMGSNWSRQEWAYARMGDIFTERIPAKVQQAVSTGYNNAENYIASYNIMMGHVLTEDGRRLFPEDMVLLSHWNLRDELKSNYADVPNASEKQDMIYRIMERIVTQEIPEEIVNNADYDWAPYSNKTWTAADGKEVTLTPETDERYARILEQFHTYQMEDAYCPTMPNAITRHFDGELEVTRDEMERLFIEIISSDQVKQVGKLISQRLGRELKPYDIWYDGFKPRSTMPEDRLTEQTRQLYPNADAFQKDMPRQLMNIGFDKAQAEYIADRIVVEPARGSGHAWETHGKWEPARLRTRIGKDGMDYKGYNIAVHEFGHNVEMVLDMYMIDHYMLNGVPNTAFTETMAFLFQNRDLQLLGYGKHSLDDNTTLDIFWGMYEIMGVSLVDMYAWQYLYDNPNATAVELRDNVLRIAREVWNKYYEPVLGTHDSPILAIYSHMVNSPMYLPAYPFGHLIHYQLEEHLESCKDNAEFAAELKRIYVQGRITPNAWMQGAVGSRVSTAPVLNAVSKILAK